MKALVLVILTVLVVAAAAVAGGLWYVRATGLSARTQPGAAEVRVARAVRSFAIPGQDRERRNPTPSSGEALAAGRSHFADHCAICHGNDGGGDTEIGRNLFPKAPDMRLAATQDLSDGELFWIIENGIRFTGMSGWSTGTKEGEEASWHLVHFIRHLPLVGEAELDEMKALNPRSPAEIRQEIEEQRFLGGSIQ